MGIRGRRENGRILSVSEKDIDRGFAAPITPPTVIPSSILSVPAHLSIPTPVPCNSALYPRSSCCFGHMKKPPNLSDWEAFLCARISHKDDLKSALFFESFDEVGRFGIFVLEVGFFVAFHCSLHYSMCCACTSIIEHIIWTSQPNRGSFSSGFQRRDETLLSTVLPSFPLPLQRRTGDRRERRTVHTPFHSIRKPRII